ncbi:ATP-dependent DNA helicase chl1 [Coemansia pectinata]|uniref:ATP-dependent DNA helicase CHL1 n=1 Tax=Coemansia pectinata TaxID=1052879 RepID=A0A9W8GPK8_9FUNG|nr:ATP-dependent DNA helicase chl1 [Coemansia pectinata]
MVTRILDETAPAECLPTPQTASEFSFPIATPYSIQLDFMQRLFETIEKREFAIFESPTGTGKSLSIICGALTWLKHDTERKARVAPIAADSVLSTTKEDQRPDWVIAYEKKQQLDASNAVGSDSDDAQQKYSRWVANTRRKEAAERKKGMMASRRAAPTDASKKRKPDEDGSTDNDDEMMVVEAYYSGDEDNAQQKSGSKLGDDGEVQYSAAVRKLLERRAGNRPLYDSSDDDNSDNDDSGESAGPPKEPSVTKIIYASRTHSQLQQFVNEIKRTQFASADKVKCVTLGSRMQLCVNDRARQGAQSVHAINERCLEMQTAGSKKSARCGYLPLQHTPMLDFKDATASVIMDIEELAKEGRRRCTCPYYGARASINGAQVVALPYNTLLSRSARQAMGISLTGSVVIVDEAHNLVDTILAIHSIALDWRTVRALLEMVQMYFTKYWRRLKGSNVTYIRQTIALLKALNKFMQSTVADSATRVVSVNEFLTLAHADHINVYKIDRYLRESKLGRKLNMFSDRLAQNNSATSNKRPTTAVRETVAGPAPATAVAAFEAFMECLGKPDRTGSRLVIRTISSNSGTEVELKYLQLDPSEAFGEICAEARAVVLAGGTMKPANDVVEQLLPGRSESQPTPDSKLDPANARLFAWSHVVDRSHICSIVVGSGPTGTALRFAHGDQGDSAKLREAGLALAALCQVIPGGVVAFFPSYALLDRMHRNWTAAGIADRIAKRKPVFVESSTSSGDVLELYSARVRAVGSTGALLLSVVGGRLSEGINFSDDLGRAVVMIGVPFPSLASPELAERLAYYEGMGGAQSTASGVIGSMGPRAKELYESLCMRAVNQSIGRAIRHRNDYAAIVFLDARYAEPRIAHKLPTWIAGSSAPNAASAFGPALAQVSSFFKREFT